MPLSTELTAITEEAGGLLGVGDIDALCAELNCGEEVALHGDLLEALGNLKLFGGCGGTDAEEAAVAAYEAALEDE